MDDVPGPWPGPYNRRPINEANVAGNRRLGFRITRGQGREASRGGTLRENWRHELQNPNENTHNFNRHTRTGFVSRGRADIRRPRINFKPRSRPQKIKGFQYIERLANNEDIQEVILELYRENAGFAQLLDNKDMTNDMVILMVKLLFNICSSTFNDVKDRSEKALNKHFWDDPNQFWTGLIKFIKTTYELIPTYCEAVQKLLKSMTVLLPLIESTHSIQISDEVKSQAANLLDLIEKTTQNLEVKKRRIDYFHLEEDEEPPNDFRDIQIIPSAQEVITDNSPFLRRNIVDRAFNSIDHYLDIQFRLLREDFVAPLRRGITTYLGNSAKPKKDWGKIDDIKIYNPIRFLNVEIINECNCYRLKFDFSKKKKSFINENSKRFMFGSLVCFTRDNFKSLLFGKIVQRDVKLLEQGLLVVGFIEEVQVDFEADYLMIESSVYFEPYYHVLNVLQTMDAYNFPMEKYIIKVEADARPPQYLLQTEPVFYKVEGHQFWALNFPNRTFYNLNESQHNAFKAALTSEFSIIQGPPGTGKTFLGLRIAQTLLENHHVWYKKTPMLIICYTNHALDQFLEGILPVTESIVRVGGQSKNEKLKNYNIVNQRRNFEHEPAVSDTRRQVRNFLEKQTELTDTLNKIEENESILNFNCFQSVVKGFYNTWFFKAKRADVIRWLMEGKSRDARNAVNITQVEQDVDDNMQLTNDQHEEDEEIEFDDILNNVLVTSTEPILSLQQLRKNLNILRRGLNMLRQEPYDLQNALRQEEHLTEIWETETDLHYLSAQLQFYQDPRTRAQPAEYDLSNPFKMKYSDRWQLYFFWLDIYAAQLRRKYIELGVEFRSLYRTYNDMREIEDTQLMKRHRVVGMTTTGAARLQSTLQALKSPIVIVEEAAEILEAHIIAALTKHCQHLILIGDHLQLKPSAADYKIETKFKLGISLFERMVTNHIECHTLNVQHRMRPEISSLVKPHIYPMLQDHESVLQREPIKGVDKCLYFIDHQEPEEVCQDSSKRNIHESKFLIGLARHLILNGYEAEQITILAAYLGQFFEMRREINRDDNKLFLQDVRISVLDNYQGEECDIILLSLVRSNTDNKAGFLRNQNRVCVALSRAKYGLYIIGNMSLLLQANSENQIWEKVKSVLEEQDAIGTHLSLKCQVHPYKITNVSKSQDFIKISEGGCDLFCEMQLACGHKCKRLCHVQDRSHAMYNCNEECLKPLCDDDAAHVCKKLCYQDCGPCIYPVKRDLKCGHTVILHCHIDVDSYRCVVPISVKLPCDHQTDTPCSADLETFKCPFPCDSRVEPCGHACSRFCHIRVDPDHLQYRCMEQCAKPRVGCRLKVDQHTCNRLCFQDCEECNEEMKRVRSCGHVYKIHCKLDVEAEKCMKPCKKMLPCEHPCKRKCSETCGECRFEVEKIIPECLHMVKMKCSQVPKRELCKEKTCRRLLPCGHRCKNPCGKPCSTNCEEFVDCNISSPCGHTVTEIMCGLKSSVDSKTLLKICDKPCGATLKCNHKCPGTCGKCMQGRIHKRCREKCGVPLVCNHECQLPCREACKPCTRDCEMRCRHSRCRKKCGEPCTPCRSPCLRYCPHRKCSRKCGEICDVPPCFEKCRKRLKCKHPCVGFCGDPCPPLCRICDEEELTEIFFGTEDEEDAIFVLLRDCGHVLEHNGLENWLNGGQNEIQFKTCPKCKTSITTTERYSDYVKKAMYDVILVKKKSFGHSSQNEATRNRLLNELDVLEISLKKFGSSDIFTIPLSKLKPRLMPSRYQRRQPISKIDLNAIQSKIQTLTHIVKCFDTAKSTISHLDTKIRSHLKMLVNVLVRYEDHTTDQENEDLECEIKRLHRMIQLHEIQMSSEFRSAQKNEDVQSLLKNSRESLFKDERFTDMLDEAVKKSLNDLVAKVNATIIISDKERMEIVAAIGMAKGHWYKCPNGHPYVIGECGGANQVARCFCGAAIGGTDHRLLPTNRLAGEMDGASRHAWPGGLY